MAEKTKSLLEGGRGDALSEGAARLERLIESVKLQHAEPVERTRPQPVNPLLSSSPGEEWARQFQSQGIGPETGTLSTAELAPVPRAMILPTPAEDVLASIKPAEIAPKSALGAPDLRFGRMEKPKKSWFGRMFQRS